MSRGESVTIHDIARHAGVSPATVSRVLTGSTPVAAEKRQAVMAIVDSLHYRPNAVAQGLARGRSWAVGVLTQDISPPYYGQFLQGIERGLRGTGYHPVFVSGAQLEEARRALDLLVSHRVDALVVMGGQIPDEDILEVAQRIPVVAIAHSLPGLEDRCLHVANVEGAYEATRHLIGLGHRRIAHLAGLASHSHSPERLEGYRRALRDADLPQDPNLVVDGDFSEAAGLSGVEELMARKVSFTAIFAGNDQIAMGAQLALSRYQLAVPRDISIVGFDDQPASAYCTPPLTTVRQPVVEMGVTAAQAVLRLLAGEKVSLPSFGTELVVRESTAPRQVKRRTAVAGRTTRRRRPAAARRTR